VTDPPNFFVTTFLYLLAFTAVCCAAILLYRPALRLVAWARDKRTRLRVLFGRGVLTELPEKNTAVGVTEEEETIAKIKEGYLPLGYVLDARTGKLTDTEHCLYLEPDKRMLHMHVVGKPGMGKSTLLLRMLYEDILENRGCTLLDAHGDTVTKIMQNIGTLRDDVIVYDPLETWCPHFNPLDLPYPAYKIAGDLTAAFHNLSPSWGVTIDEILLHTIQALMEDEEKHPLKHILTFLNREDYRDEIVERMQREELREYWEHTYPSYGKSAHTGVTNKLSKLLDTSSPIGRNLDCVENEIDFSDIMNNGHVLLVKLSAGRNTKPLAYTVGALMTSCIQTAALARDELPESERTPHFLYVDEFQYFITDTIHELITDGRKYKLGIILAHQSFSQPQLSDDLVNMVLGCHALIAFRAYNAKDAARLAREIRGQRMVIRNKETNETIDHDTFREQIIAFCTTLAETETFEVKRTGRTMHVPEDTQYEAKAWAKRLTEWTPSAKLYRDLCAVKVDFVDDELERYRFPLTNWEYEVIEDNFPAEDDFLNLNEHEFVIRLGKASNYLRMQNLPFLSLSDEAANALRDEQERKYKRIEPSPLAVVKSEEDTRQSPDDDPYAY